MTDVFEVVAGAVVLNVVREGLLEVDEGCVVLALGPVAFAALALPTQACGHHARGSSDTER